MKTDNQLIIEQDTHLAELKDHLKKGLLELLELQHQAGSLESKRSKLLSVYAAGVGIFNEIEAYAANSALLKAQYDAEWAMSFAETCLNWLDSIWQFYDTVRLYADTYELPRNRFVPSLTAFANMQRRLVEHCPDQADRIRKEFELRNLPTRGFERPFIRPIPLWQQILGWVFIGSFLAAMLAFAVMFPSPTREQFFVFRFVLALISGFAGSIFSGHIRVDGKVRGISVRAGGGFALFVLVYMVNPGTLGK